MELAPNRYACARCGDVFERRHRTGRRPHYCSHTCRQRAYEARRRGAEHHRLPTPELAFLRSPDRPDHAPAAHHYEPGHGRTRTHALRPDGPPDRRGARPTLCGSRAHALRVLRPFGRGGHALPVCRTCSTIAARYPLEEPIRPSADLARIKHLLRDARRRVRRGDAVARRLLVDRLYLLTEPAAD